MNRVAIAILTVVVVVAAPASARADGFIVPFVGYNFGGDSGNCPRLTNCTDRHANFGVSLGTMGTLFGAEFDLGYAKNFFGEVPGTDNSVLTAMFNVLGGIGVGPVRPYVLAGVGLIRPHVSSITLSSDNNAFGYDLGGGLTLSVAPHVGIRGDIRHLHTAQTINVLFFNDQRLDFFRASLGLSVRF